MSILGAIGSVFNITPTDGKLDKKTQQKKQQKNPKLLILQKKQMKLS